MKRAIPFFGLICIIYFTSIFMSGCKNTGNTFSEYDLRLDSVHLGIQLGMGRQEFYDYCWELNKSGQNITQGHHNTSVMHTDSVNFKLPTEINFYPQFNKNSKVYILPVRYEYRAWAPWNTEAHADKLILEVKDLMEKSYGGSFQKKDVNGKEVWFKHDNPRLITIYTEDDHYVHVKFKNERFRDEE